MALAGFDKLVRGESISPLGLAESEPDVRLLSAGQEMAGLYVGGAFGAGVDVER